MNDGNDGGNDDNEGNDDNAVGADAAAAGGDGNAGFVSDSVSAATHDGDEEQTQGNNHQDPTMAQGQQDLPQQQQQQQYYVQNPVNGHGAVNEQMVVPMQMPMPMQMPFSTHPQQHPPYPQQKYPSPQYPQQQQQQQGQAPYVANQFQLDPQQQQQQFFGPGGGLPSQMSPPVAATTMTMTGVPPSTNGPTFPVGQPGLQPFYQAQMNVAAAVYANAAAALVTANMASATPGGGGGNVAPIPLGPGMQPGMQQGIPPTPSASTPMSINHGLANLNFQSTPQAVPSQQQSAVFFPPPPAFGGHAHDAATAQFNNNAGDPTMVQQQQQQQQYFGSGPGGPSYYCSDGGQYNHSTSRRSRRRKTRHVVYQNQQQPMQQQQYRHRQQQQQQHQHEHRRQYPRHHDSDGGPSSNTMHPMALSGGEVTSYNRGGRRRNVESSTYHRYSEQQQQQQRQTSSSSGKRGRRAGGRFWNETTSSDSDPVEYTGSGRLTGFGTARQNSYNPSSRSSGSSNNNYNSNINNTRHGSKRRNKKLALMASSSSDGGNSAAWTSKKKPRQALPAGSGLIGKMASSTLYELCAKQKLDSPLVDIVEIPFDADGRAVDDENDDDDEIIRHDMKNIVRGKSKSFYRAKISINGEEVATGYGVKKSTAKNIACVRGIHQILPGVEFDERFMIIGVPDEGDQEHVSFPTLTESSAQSGAVNERNQSARSDETFISNSTGRDAAIAHTALDRLVEQQLAIGHDDGETSNTSDDESTNDFERVNNEWEPSALLHELLQNEPRVKDGPIYTYTHTNPPRGRYSHECTVEVTLFIGFDQPLTNRRWSSDSLQAVNAHAFGSSKRDAVQSAHVYLLTNLFPQCRGLDEVKIAAEAIISERDNIAEAKSNFERSIPSHLELEVAATHAHRLPPSIENQMLGIFEAKSKTGNNGSMIHHGSSTVESEIHADTDTVVCHRTPVMASRNQQLENAVQVALQKLNDHDEDGRIRLSVPEQLGEEDVGRTVLRTAQLPDDIHWLETLLERPMPNDGERDRFYLSVFGQDTDTIPGTTIVLLLCRAIEPFDDPPLGCAVLSLGFSMQDGKILRITDIVTKAHLPLERFMECLESFASCMGCKLKRLVNPSRSAITNNDDSSLVQSSNLQHFFYDGLQSRVRAEQLNCGRPDTIHQDHHHHQNQQQYHLQALERRKTPLQSVKEVHEEDELEDRSKKRSKSNDD